MTATPATVQKAPGDGFVDATPPASNEADPIELPQAVEEFEKVVGLPASR